ncbi:hypothetical protein [Mesobacillus selenatarsenatis]|uniref:Uncharacterized protein n=1 Tax=Mesobacillus selenatarsenatis TaxID=388741 RepID=A0A846T727_9BACI|nr:hypothetical protein [Mesobacillus selenatarsenatis]NKE04718.1 hypothetical protein [Mesobacillus selenatarsenatis]
MNYFIEYINKIAACNFSIGIAVGVLLTYIVLILLHKIEVYQWVKITLSLFLYFFVVMIIGHFGLKYTHWMFDTRHDGYAGNFIGGIIGGAVAYLIAFQQNHQKNKQVQKILDKKYQATIIALDSELSYNNEILRNVMMHLRNESTSLKIPFQTKTWDEISLDADLIERLSTEEYKSISKTYTEIFLYKDANISKKALIQLEENIKEILELISEKGKGV